MIFRSIKWRLQLWHGLILLLVLSGFGYTAFELQRTRELRRVDGELQDRMGLLLGPLRRPGRPPGGRQPFRSPEQRDDRPLPADESPNRPQQPLSAEIDRERDREFPEDGPFFYAVWDRNGRLIRSGGLPEGISASRPRKRPGVVQAQEYRELHHQSPRGETIAVGRSIAVELKELRNLALFLAITGAGVFVVGLVGGWIVATRAMRPIDKISSTAQKISTGDLSQRIAHEESESELGRLVAILNSTFGRLESAFAEQVRFTTDVSHELRTPVSVIVSQTQMALSRERPALEYRESLEACQRAAQRMRRLIESLLQLSRLDAGQEEIRTTPFDLSALAKDCAELLRPLATEKKVNLDFDLGPVQALGDPDKICQVITNLLSNAIQYTPEQGTIKLVCRLEDRLATLSVIDTGVGIPAEDLPHIFDRFYRVDTSRARDKGGSGLGLAIARAIVHAHSGTLTAISAPGKGATLVMRLPSPPDTSPM